MKKNILIFILGTTLLVSCKKVKPVTVPVEFNSTTYDTLCNFNNSGLPANLLPRDVISPSLQHFMDTLLPEQHNLNLTHPELLSTTAIADIQVTHHCDVYITYISEHTQFKNTFAFYTYTTGLSPAKADDIKKITYVFPNAGSGTTLYLGDKIKIGTFEAGTSIGFVLLHDAWNSDTHSINSKAAHYCTNDVLNPEVDPHLKKHAILINYPAENKVLIGFEDLNRTDPSCDSDFNDLLLYCTITP